MAEKSTFENELPKKSTVKWLRGLDENGNPVLIDISDHATVVGGLLPNATASNKGLISQTDYSRKLQSTNLAGGKIWKIAKLNVYQSIRLLGVSTGNDVSLIDIGIARYASGIKVLGKPSYVTIKMDSGYNIYISVPNSQSINANFLGAGMLPLEEVLQYPSGVVDI